MEVNLSVCEEVTIEITYKLQNTEEINIEQITSFSDAGVDIFNIHDDFFNDICFPYTDNGTDSDMILKDRIKDIYQNYSICEDVCEYNSFDPNDISVKCDCKIKTEVKGETSKPKLESFILSPFLDSNFGVIKCSNLVFSTKGKANNKGFWLLLTFSILHIPCFVFYFLNGVIPISNNLKIEMKNKNYEIEDSINVPPRKKPIISKFGAKSVHSINNVITSKIDTENNNLDKNFENNLDKNEKINDDIEIIQQNLNTKEIIYNTKEEKVEIAHDFNIIKLNADNNSKYIPYNSNYQLDNYEYVEALIYEHRSFWRIFFIYFISKNNIFNLIYVNPPLELKPLRICIVIFNYTLDFSLNAFFYLSDNISDKYHYKGNYRLLFTFVNNIIKSLVSTVVGIIFMILFKLLSQSNDKIKDLFKEEERKMKENKDYKVSKEKKMEINNEINKILKKSKINILLFIILEIIILLFFFYYVTAFCHVYKNIQTSLLLDMVSSFVLGFLITMGISLLGTICYNR